MVARGLTDRSARGGAGQERPARVGARPGRGVDDVPQRDRRAVQSGVDAVIVSNHGGRQLDGVPATLHALVEVSAAVRGACPVIMDGGVRGGADVFAALALGAAAVLIGRPALWALAVDGADGVGDLLELLGEELAHTMALAGRPTLAAIDRTAVDVT